ncbi:hypothetical protein EES42_30995 [Streptomyces sp. ADI95-17]|nr:hypothetical protein EES42_30995 [Streptomyces sp. ADI95-17]
MAHANAHPWTQAPGKPLPAAGHPRDPLTRPAGPQPPTNAAPLFSPAPSMLPKGTPRPDYVVCRDTEPLRPLEAPFSEVLRMMKA